MVTWIAGKRGCSAGNRGRLWIADRCGGLVGADSLYFNCLHIHIQFSHSCPTLLFVITCPKRWWDVCEHTYSERRWWWSFRSVEKHATRPRCLSRSPLRSIKLWGFLDSHKLKK
ncbi:hypothetical protein Y032_0528g2979 [Ancylostoma ceylanicum]|uniref:Uncharacterized protein n=1 Tax=Ancylostoma ceylanicum TaxID=53326 RepID=A0A016WU33_9BILA|nr:hypothetical protein Y032_0528g2979 [Ancylostoma ceylanicum]